MGSRFSAKSWKFIFLWQFRFCCNRGLCGRTFRHEHGFRIVVLFHWLISGRTMPVGLCCRVLVMRDASHSSFDFSAEFQRHYRSLWLVAMGIVSNGADADDVMQEAAIVAIRKLNTFTPGTSFRAWMGEVVRNVGLNRRRQNVRYTRRFGHSAAAGNLADIEENGGGRAQAAAAAGDASIDEGLLEALEQLGDVPRTCILLRCVEGLGYPEISQLLDIPKGTAMSHVFRGRRELARYLSRDEQAER